MVQMRSAFKPACDWAIPLAQVNGRPQLSKAEDCDCSKWGILSSHSDAFEALNMDVRVSVLGRIGQRNLVGFMDDVFLWWKVQVGWIRYLSPMVIEWQIGNT